MRNIYRYLPASGIREIFDRALEIEKMGEQVIHLEIGRPAWKLPPGVLLGAKQALDDGFVHYIHNRGIKELRQVIADDLKNTTGNIYDPEKEIIITTGASEGLAMSALALLGPGDEMIIPEPAWPHYRVIAQLTGATPIPVPLSPEDGFLIDPDAIKARISDRTKMLVINNPSNPTGAVQSKEILQELGNIAHQFGIYVLADEVYKHFVYEGQHYSLATIMAGSNFLILLDSLSKSYAMTGWRIGYVAASPELSDAMNRIHQYLTVCGVSFSQKGAVEIFNHPERQAYIEEMRFEFKKRRSVWKNALVNTPKVQLIPPNGAFYMFPKIDFQNMTGRQFCQFMLEEHKIAMVPGDVFGESFKRYIRISFGGDLETQYIAANTFSSVFMGR